MEHNPLETEYLFRQSGKIIEDDILNGVISEDARIPTREIANRYGVNHATVTKGINILEDEGIVYKKRGIGWLVSSGAVELIRMKRKKLFYDKHLPQILEDAFNLGITKEEIVKHIAEKG